MRKLFPVVAALLVITIAFISCKKTSQSGAPAQQNQRPVADAGLDQITTLPHDSSELNGRGTDPDGIVVNYAWTIRAYYSMIGREDLFNYSGQNVKLKGLPQGWYWCTLIVTDNGGLTATDEAVIRVVSNGCPCYPDPCDAFGDPCNPWDY
jgi:hypothetical protein